MLKRHFLPISLMGLLSACFSHQPPVVENESDVVVFLSSKSYRYYTERKYIPVNLIDSLSRINKEQFLIGDSHDKHINLTDASFRKGEFKKKLNFLLLGENGCLLSYEEGGIARHSMIDLFEYKGGFKHTRVVTASDISDTVKLKALLKSNGLHLTE